MQLLSGRTFGNSIMGGHHPNGTATNRGQWCGLHRLDASLKQHTQCLGASEYRTLPHVLHNDPLKHFESGRAGCGFSMTYGIKESEKGSEKPSCTMIRSLLDSGSTTWRLPLSAEVMVIATWSMWVS